MSGWVGDASLAASIFHEEGIDRMLSLVGLDHPNLASTRSEKSYTLSARLQPLIQFARLSV